MEEGRLAYRVRTAEASDAAALRDAIGSTLAHPDHQGRRESYRGAASRGDILILERFDRTSHDWHVAGFIECHLRVDDNLSIHDIGTAGDEPQTGVVRYLLEQAFNSFRPAESQIKIRRDATTWLEIFRNIPGFHLEGEEYRRPHYWTIWSWNRERARKDEARARQPAQRQGQGQQGPRPPRPPTAPQPTQNGTTQRESRPFEPREQPRERRPGGGYGGPQPRGPRPTGADGPPPRGPRPSGPGGPPQRNSRPGGPSSGGPRRSGRPSRPPNPR